jgi:UDP-glucose 4-epimerase
MVNILLTCGVGYIGSHAAVVLSQAGHEVVLLDNFCNSSPSVLERLQKILNKSLPCIEADVRDTDVIEKVLREYKIDAVIHFASLKSVAESIANPLLYYANNVQGSISLLLAIQKVGVKTLAFSSTATVYGEPQYLPYDENHPTKPMNPYGQSKLKTEEILRDLATLNSEWKIINLRYFNPVGAHESGLIGEDPNGIPNNLMPYVAKVILGELPYLNNFGDDYETRDGTGERDYIHVMDLAEGHIAALSYLAKSESGNQAVFNLGTGKSISEKEIISAFEKVSRQELKKGVSQKRQGDLPINFYDTTKAQSLLNWRAKRFLQDMCQDSWNFSQLRDQRHPS